MCSECQSTVPSAQQIGRAVKGRARVLKENEVGVNVYVVFFSFSSSILFFFFPL